MPIHVCDLTLKRKYLISLNESPLNLTRVFFRHATSVRNSSYPFISGDTFRGFADHVFDETTNISTWKMRVKQIKNGDIVFVQSEQRNMDVFFLQGYFNRIRNRFILITHNSDDPIPTKKYNSFLDSYKILAWFTQNPDIIHKKLFPIPIGMANRRWLHGDVNIIRDAVCSHRKPFDQRRTLLYVNFDVKTNRKARSKALAWAKNITAINMRPIRSFSYYLKELGDAKFVLSPPGNGLDCHRTWEALLMGAVPIVERSPLDPLFANENILLVQKWDDLKPDYLKTFSFVSHISSKLFARYWYQHLRQLAEMSRNENRTKLAVPSIPDQRRSTSNFSFYQKRQ